jgi:hypothetical protein
VFFGGWVEGGDWGGKGERGGVWVVWVQVRFLGGLGVHGLVVMSRGFYG